MKQFSTSLFGYQRQQVDQKIQTMQAQIDELKGELSRLNDQISQLETSLGDYQEIESALTKSIVDARQAGERIIGEANANREILINQANKQVRQMQEDFTTQGRELAESGSNLRTEFNTMKDKLQAVLDSYQALLDETDFDNLYPASHVTRFINQVNAFEVEDDLLPVSEDGDASIESMSEEEKIELESLIHEVVANEGQHEGKLVDFRNMQGMN